jgi:hypothetical protein
LSIPNPPLKFDREPFALALLLFNPGEGREVFVVVCDSIREFKFDEEDKTAEEGRGGLVQAMTFSPSFRPDGRVSNRTTVARALVTESSRRVASLSVEKVEAFQEEEIVVEVVVFPFVVKGFCDTNVTVCFGESSRSQGIDSVAVAFRAGVVFAASTHVSFAFIVVTGAGEPEEETDF